MLDGEGLLHMAQKSLGPINIDINCKKKYEKRILVNDTIRTIY